jgi:hypothetical protein
MTDLDDLRKRVEEWGGKREHHPGWLVYDLWHAVQELEAEIKELKTRLGFWERKP